MSEMDDLCSRGMRIKRRDKILSGCRLETTKLKKLELEFKETHPLTDSALSASVLYYSETGFSLSRLSLVYSIFYLPVSLLVYQLVHVPIESLLSIYLSIRLLRSIKTSIEIFNYPLNSL